MSTSLLYHAYGINGVKYKSTHFEAGIVVIRAEMTRKYADCPICHNCRTSFKGLKIRRFRMLPFGRKPCFLEVELHRLECPNCNHIWWPSLPFMDGKKRMTRSFIRYALDLLGFCTISAVASLLELSWDTIKDLHKEKLSKQYRSISISNISAIGIDEFSIAKGQSYMTIVTDLDQGRILHAVEGRDKMAILPFLKKLNRYAPLLKVVAMDMAKSYIAAVKEALPKCDIVFDRFHVTALLTKSLDEIRKEQQSKCSREGMRTIKGSRFLLLKNYENLNPKKRDSLEALLSINEPLSIGHAMKEQFRLFWTKTNRKEAAHFLCRWIVDALETGLKPLESVGKCLLNHAEGLLNYFTHRVSNALTEGINNKIKTLKRQAYGYRDLKYFKLRLYHLHTSRYSFPG